MIISYSLSYCFLILEVLKSFLKQRFKNPAAIWPLTYIVMRLFLFMSSSFSDVSSYSGGLLVGDDSKFLIFIIGHFFPMDSCLRYTLEGG